MAPHAKTSEQQLILEKFINDFKRASIAYDQCDQS